MDMKPTTQCKDVVTGEGAATAARSAVGGRVHLGRFLVGGVALVGMVAVSMVGGAKVIQDVDRTPLVGVAESTANPNPDAGLNDPAGPGAAPAPSQPGRVGGGGAAATAIQVSRRAFPGSAAEVYLARLDNPVDALAASVMPNGPILLVPTDGNVPPAVFEEIKRLNPGKVVLLGGKSAISDNVAGQITTYTGKNTVRVSGANRVATAAAIASYAYPGGNPTVYVADAMGADGKGSPDAVAAGVLTDGPIITVTANGGDIATAAQTVKALGANRVVALGGKAAVSDATLNQVAGGSATDRISGPNRYQTSVAIGQRVFGTSAGNVYLASGTDLAYALVAGSLTDGPIILVPGAADGNTRGLVTSFGNPNVNAIGDGSSVSDSVLQVAAGYAQPQAAQQPQKSSAPVAGVSQVYTKYSMQPSPTDGAREEAIYNAINGTRTGHGVPALTRDPVMDDAARAWAQQVARTDVFVHSNGALKYADLFPAGWKYAGENMVGYYNIEPGPYAAGCNDLWVKSPGHYKNLIDGRFNRTGIGVATGRTWVYAVQNFGQY
ncbi:cell wall-binding repeat-containing protein [Mobiluncus mulieris]|uniref:cell wall-binding repeat-containing protein n=2 Tax=Mobiluncus mulieris TaxID=2052 RepID=UPI00019F8F1C|nr:cell wall-binding repeat-containing protein [Mobiluncus mulieris]EEJ53075.1 SCP-like protein [Mobiluncus mulieris ATCC 35243]MCU9971884.1 LytC protein [Mobiluncus mulieris]MCU9976334.1 LytC protein [Mobiluncus mulieris]MCU9996172.1 LytC protein [Mobiluncus mulieris]MCV0002413.1 LytC protein [Mobiluncus mulieris]